MKNGLLFVSDESKNVVDVFPKNHAASPIGTISNEISTPVGLAVDGGGNLYVANLGNSTITEYAPPYSSGPLATYSAGLASPTQVAVGVDGTVYVAEFVNGSVVEFPPGSVSPSLTLALGQEPEGVALDANNNLYVVSEVPSGVGEITEYSPGASSGTNLGISIRFPGPLTFDAAGDIVVSAQTLPGVLIFPPGATSPSQIINDGFKDPFGLAFGVLERRLYVSDAGNSNVQSIAYPAGNSVNTISGIVVGGVALSPPAPK